MIDVFVGSIFLTFFGAILLYASIVDFDIPKKHIRKHLMAVGVLWITSELFMTVFTLACLCIGTAWSIPNLFMRMAVILTEIFLFYFVEKAIVKATTVLIKFILKISH